ncbi:lysoplasmalogenase [Chitinophaga horti]|uniref:Lysoplasmalogenase n=1 Tax=Chitinophaga horti TaxID=2920382 RepID=A0ABY6J054_9BACT|nr:lysoplasmalogenase [Chitinophaga horti]UYQ93027.1 lysoplasmalogenase [Chitinophaga horti]
MKKKIWGLLYFSVLALDVLAIAIDLPFPRYFTKPLLMIMLALHYWSEALYIEQPVRNLIFAALIFSWWGDTLLLFEQNSNMFFLGGLTSFLMAHVAYIIFFARVEHAERFVRPRHIAWTCFSIVYAMGLLYLLYPNMEGLRLPVFLYAAVITAMLLSAIYAFAFKNTLASFLCILGAVLFVLSDTLLAVRKFYSPNSIASVAVMITYGIAQWCLVEGSLKHMKS